MMKPRSTSTQPPRDACGTSKTHEVLARLRDGCAAGLKAARASAACLAIGAGHMAAFAAPTGPAPSGTQVYKCAQADGSVLYSHHACEAAASTDKLHIKDARTPAQIQQGQAMHERTEDLAGRMQKDRQRLERQAAGHKAMALTTSPAIKVKAAKASDASRSRKQDKAGKEPKKDPRMSKPSRRADFTARVPASSRKQQGGGASP